MDPSSDQLLDLLVDLKEILSSIDTKLSDTSSEFTLEDQNLKLDEHTEILLDIKNILKEIKIGKV